MIKKIFKNWYLFIPTIILLMAIGDLDYAYYQILRIVVMVFAIIFVLILKAFKNVPLMVIMIIIAVLFNPILPFYLDKDVWIVLDFISSILFLISVLYIIRNKRI